MWVCGSGAPYVLRNDGAFMAGTTAKPLMDAPPPTVSTFSPTTMPSDSVMMTTGNGGPTVKVSEVQELPDSQDPNDLSHIPPVVPEMHVDDPETRTVKYENTGGVPAQAATSPERIEDTLHDSQPQPQPPLPGMNGETQVVDNGTEVSQVQEAHPSIAAPATPPLLPAAHQTTSEKAQAEKPEAPLTSPACQPGSLTERHATTARTKRQDATYFQCIGCMLQYMLHMCLCLCACLLGLDRGLGFFKDAPPLQASF